MRVLVPFLAMLGLTLVLWAQQPGASALVLRIEPEAHLSPSSAAFSFAVNEPGETVLSAPISITAWVRALPNQQIQLAAQGIRLTGPAGAVPASAVTWSGVMANATAGARAAACTSGSFGATSPWQLIAGWTQSGIATCTVTFSLETAASWARGAYIGEAGFTLLTQSL